MKSDLKSRNIGIIGLGYVGLPLLIEFSKSFPIIGYDINSERVNQLKDGKDFTNEVEKNALSTISPDSFTDKVDDIADCNVYIVTVPTPIDTQNQPNLKPLKSACRTIGKIIKRDDIVIFESTVFPGATEEVCAPIIERESGLSCNKDFFLGYSPERINPGDRDRRVSDIVKITSGSTPEIADLIDDLYSEIISAGTYKAPSIKVAEAAKVIENTQRDLNIALVNELSKIFNLIDIDTEEVINAAATKWNFIPMKPGLVGGHCIGVDPYYLTFKAQELGYDPEVILSGRRLNNSMGPYVAEKCIELLLRNKKDLSKSKVLVMGYTFKENCPDVRNTRVIDIINKLKKFCKIDIFDPWVLIKDVDDEFVQSNLIESIDHKDKYDAIIIAVAHDLFKDMNQSQIRDLTSKNAPILDIKGIFQKTSSDFRL